MERIQRFKENHQEGLRRLSFIRFVGIVLMTIADIVTDFASGIQQLLRGDTLGFVAGPIILCLMLLPGLTVGLSVIKSISWMITQKGANVKKLLKKVILKCVFFQYYLVKVGIQSIRFELKHLTTGEENLKRDYFLSQKTHEIILEGGCQAVVSLYIIMLTPDEDHTLNTISLVFSVLSVAQGCASRVSLRDIDEVIQIKFSGKLLSGFTVPNFLFISVTAYPTITIITQYLKKIDFNENSILWIMIGLIVAHVILWMWSLTRIYLIFYKQRYRVVNIKSFLNKTLPSDLFWRIASPKNKILYLFSIFSSDIIMLTMNSVALFLDHDGNFRIILSVFSLIQVIAIVFNLIYAIKPKWFIAVSPAMVFLELGHMIVKLTHSGNTIENVPQNSNNTLFYYQQISEYVMKINTSRTKALTMKTVEILNKLEEIEKKDETAIKIRIRQKLDIIEKKIELLNKTFKFEKGKCSLHDNYVKQLDSIISELEYLEEDWNPNDGKWNTDKFKDEIFASFQQAEHSSSKDETTTMKLLNEKDLKTNAIQELKVSDKNNDSDRKIAIFYIQVDDEDDTEQSLQANKEHGKIYRDDQKINDDQENELGYRK